MKCYRSIALVAAYGMVTLLGRHRLAAVETGSSFASVGTTGESLPSPIVDAACCAPERHRRWLHPWQTTIAPPGNLSPRYPYSTWRTYYYDRPYNADHVVRAQQEVPVNPAAPYSNHAMEDVFRQAEQRAWERQRAQLHSLSPADDSLRIFQQDGYLEYTDWQKHRAQRLRWEAEAGDASSLLPADHK